jgi:hypothetical protein
MGRKKGQKTEKRVKKWSKSDFFAKTCKKTWKNTQKGLIMIENRSKKGPFFGP